MGTGRAAGLNAGAAAGLNGAAGAAAAGSSSDGTAAGAGARAGAATVAVSVRYLSAVREKAGTRRDDLALAAGATLADAAAWIRRERGLEVPGPGLMATLNGRGWTQLAGGTATPLSDGDEIALFPLLSGG